MNRVPQRVEASFAGTFLAALALPALLAADLRCGGPNRFVVSYPHPEGAPAESVGFPPPPAQIETLSTEPPASGCLWADGQWVWVAQRWDWRPGGWILPPEGCRYSAPTTSWALGPDGASVLYYRPGRWYSVIQSRVCPDPVSCPTSLTSPAP
jgi:hypothetical protein